ncbi:MAG: DinB family protein, partial [Bacteroidia bacterium]
MEHEELIRTQLVKLLEGDQSYRKMENALQELSFDVVHLKPDGFPYSIWQLVEHIRIAQWDIVEFSNSAHHISPKWPDEYWPQETGPKNQQEWKTSLKKIEVYQDELKRMIKDPENDLMKAFEWGSGQTLFREVLFLPEHNAYHMGQI